MSSKFDVRQALRNLDIEIKPWGYTGHSLPDLPIEDRATLRGYSSDRWLAINPNERWPEVVTFHEATHILRGDTTVYKDFGIDFKKLFALRESHKEPSPQEAYMFEQFAEYKEKYHDVIEAECHVTAILTAQMTGSPLDYAAELSQLIRCYSLGRDLPDEMVNRAYQRAKTIEQAGTVRKRIWAA